MEFCAKEVSGRGPHFTLFMNFWIPSPESWKGQDAFLIGGGSSLLHFDFASLRGKNVIGCNDACYLGFPPLSYCVFGDSGWWHRNRLEIEKMPGPFVTNAPAVLHLKLANVFKMKRVRDGLQTEGTLGWNFSTGALAINLAVSLGAQRIFLLGYDLQDQNQKSHWHNRNVKPTRTHVFSRFHQGFARIAQDLKSRPGVSIFNVTDGSSQLKEWPFFSFSELGAVLQKQTVLLTPDIKESECVPAL